MILNVFGKKCDFSPSTADKTFVSMVTLFVPNKSWGEGGRGGVSLPNVTNIGVKYISYLAFTFILNKIEVKVRNQLNSDTVKIFTNKKRRGLDFRMPQTVLNEL